MPNAPHNVCAERSLPELLRLRVVNVTMPASFLPERNGGLCKVGGRKVMGQHLLRFSGLEVRKPLLNHAGDLLRAAPAGGS